MAAGPEQRGLGAADATRQLTPLLTSQHYAALLRIQTLPIEWISGSEFDADSYWDSDPP